MFNIINNKIFKNDFFIKINFNLVWRTRLIINNINKNNNIKLIKISYKDYKNIDNILRDSVEMVSVYDDRTKEGKFEKYFNENGIVKVEETKLNEL